jgi:phenylalanyl-tRNA synthetase beta chain
MLDKNYKVDDETVIDLELRGNRSDMLGLIGVARDVSAAFNTPLLIPSVASLPKIDPESTLVEVQALDLVERFLAFDLRVTVGPSPDWLVRQLAFYSIPSINNVVDLTNYCMLETGEPMHAYDRAKIAGGRLVLRRAKPGEQLVTMMGMLVTLSNDDLVICDEQEPQALAMIGGQQSRITEQTTEILLAAAVYNQANVRRSARRLNMRTEAGIRHEKLLDPNSVTFALERALYLLQIHTNAEVIGAACDFYPHPVNPTRILMPFADIRRLTGANVPVDDAQQILSRLSCTVAVIGDVLDVTVPTFRTDIEQSADLVEEIIRIYGYDKIPVRPLSGPMPAPAPSSMVLLAERVRDLLVALQCNEVITSPLIRNSAVQIYEQENSYPTPIILENSPDVDTSTLRPSLLPNLVDYAQRSIRQRQKRVNFFEIGKVYNQQVRGDYQEQTYVALIVGGETDNRSWNRQPRRLSVYDLKGIVEGLCQGLGIDYRVEPMSSHPSIDPDIQGMFYTGQNHILGSFGQLHAEIADALGISQSLFVAELSLDLILDSPKGLVQSYKIATPYPPVIEDMAFIVPDYFQFGPFLESLKHISRLIVDVSLLDVFEKSRTVRIIYADSTRTLSTEDVKPIREHIIQFVKSTYGVYLKGKDL